MNGDAQDVRRSCRAMVFILLILAPYGVSAGLETGITVDVNGQPRTYDLYVPNGLGNPAPLVIDMHGYSVQANDQRRRSGFHNLADLERFVVAWPRGQARQWNSAFGAAGTDDVGALREIVAHISGNHAIDPKRIYATGFSQGGAMAYRLACEAADLFAAFVSVAGAVHDGSEPDCNPARPVPVMSFRGRDDGIVPYAGGVVPVTGERIISASQSHEFWKEIDGCQGADQGQNIGSATCTTNSVCDGNVAVTSCTVEGGGPPDNHDLYSVQGLDVARASWDFMRTYSLPELQGGFSINPGLTDAWYSPATNGQGFLLTVFPSIEQMFVAWFTFDAERPPADATAIIGEPGHRWLTAQGAYAGDTATLTLFVTEGGVFDSGNPAATTDPAGVGTMTIEFADCANAMVTYEIPSAGLSGSIPVERIANDNVARCEALGEQ